MMNENQDTTEQISVWASDFDENGNQRFHKKIMIPKRFEKKIMEEYQQLSCDAFPEKYMCPACKADLTDQLVEEVQNDCFFHEKLSMLCWHCDIDLIVERQPNGLYLVFVDTDQYENMNRKDHG